LKYAVGSIVGALPPTVALYTDHQPEGYSSADGTVDEGSCSDLLVVTFRPSVDRLRHRPLRRGSYV